ncbi:MAG: nucleotidyltransferase family protein [Planctomycetota bacterium]
MPLHIQIDQQQLAEFCRSNHIRRLSVFGSALRDDFGPDSDVDVLVEFEEEHVPGLLGMGRLQRQLSELLGRQADVRTPGDLSRYFRDQVTAEAEEQYAA